MKTLAPSVRNSSHAVAPRPEVPPVTNTTRSLKRSIITFVVKQERLSDELSRRTLYRRLKMSLDLLQQLSSHRAHPAVNYGMAHRSSTARHVRRTMLNCTAERIASLVGLTIFRRKKLWLTLSPDSPPTSLKQYRQTPP